ncbi:hypothetical protein ROZALSC1DRAFT_30666, partial [Rozella allomycis CSF55]
IVTPLEINSKNDYTPEYLNRFVAWLTFVSNDPILGKYYSECKVKTTQIDHLLMIEEQKPEEPYDEEILNMISPIFEKEDLYAFQLFLQSRVTTTYEARDMLSWLMTEYHSNFSIFYPEIKKLNVLQAEDLLYEYVEPSTNTTIYVPFTELALVIHDIEKAISIFKAIAEDFPDLLLLRNNKRRGFFHTYKAFKEKTIEPYKFALSKISPDDYYIVRDVSKNGYDLIEEYIILKDFEYVKFLIDENLYPLSYRVQSSFTVSQILLIHSCNDLFKHYMKTKPEYLKTSLDMKTPYLHSLLILAAAGDNWDSEIYEFILDTFPKSVSVKNVYGEDIFQFLERKKYSNIQKSLQELVEEKKQKQRQAKIAQMLSQIEKKREIADLDDFTSSISDSSIISFESKKQIDCIDQPLEVISTGIIKENEEDLDKLDEKVHDLDNVYRELEVSAEDDFQSELEESKGQVLVANEQITNGNELDSQNDTKEVVESNAFLDNMEIYKKLVDNDNFEKMSNLFNAIIKHTKDKATGIFNIMHCFAFIEDDTKVFKLSSVIANGSSIFIPSFSVSEIFELVFFTFLDPHFDQHEECAWINCERRLVNTIKAASVFRHHGLLPRRIFSQKISEILEEIKFNDKFDKGNSFIESLLIAIFQQEAYLNVHSINVLSDIMKQRKLL